LVGKDDTSTSYTAKQQIHASKLIVVVCLRYVVVGALTLYDAYLFIEPLILVHKCSSLLYRVLFFNDSVVNASWKHVNVYNERQLQQRLYTQCNVTK